MRVLLLLAALLVLTAPTQAQRSLAEKIGDLRHSAAVRTVLVEHAQTAPYDIRVRTENGIVTLTGIVPTLGVRNQAADLAASVSGTQTVRNEINLDGQAATPVTVTTTIVEPEPVATEPPPAQPAPEAASDSDGPVYHRVARGETLFSLARRYETTVDAIQQLNRLGSSTTIEVGQRLRVK